MKKIIILLLATILFTACEYDNYDAPSVTFSGQLLYNDKPFLCDGNDARDIFLFFQEGFYISRHGPLYFLKYLCFALCGGAAVLFL